MSLRFIIPTIYTAIDQQSSVVSKMGRAIDAYAEKYDKLNSKFEGLRSGAQSIATQTGMVGAAIIAPLAMAANAAIAFQDKMADVGKTTGLKGTALENFGNQILEMSKKTRTSIDDLVKIGEIGGQLGIASNELISFTEAANKFNVALGADYSGGVEEAISSIGKLQSLFKETRAMPIADVITKAGSAINQLGAEGSATSKNINDFVVRLGLMPAGLKPSITDAMALGAVFEEAGLDAERGSSGFANFMVIASKNLPAFAKQMHVGMDAATKLLNTDPTRFAAKFSSTFNGISGDKLGKMLEGFKLNSTETNAVVSALSTNLEKLTQRQSSASQAFAEGTSLTNEYNTKNNTTAAKLAMAQNQFQALAITIGTKLLPVISKMLDSVMPIIDAVGLWITQNPGLTQGILILVGALGGLLTIVAAVTGIVALFASPVALIVAGVILLIAGIALLIAKWEKWGRYVALFLGPLGMIITLIEALYRNWGMITKAFKDGGIIGGIKAIAKVLIDVLLTPVQSLLNILAKLPGGLGDYAEKASKELYKFREQTLGVTVNNNSPEKINKTFEEQQAQQKLMEKIIINNSFAEIRVKAEKGTEATADKTVGIRPIVTQNVGKW